MPSKIDWHCKASPIFLEKGIEKIAIIIELNVYEILAGKPEATIENGVNTKTWLFQSRD